MKSGFPPLSLLSYSNFFQECLTTVPKRSTAYVASVGHSLSWFLAVSAPQGTNLLFLESQLSNVDVAEFCRIWRDYLSVR